MTREQLDKRIEEVCEQFQGQFPDLFQIIGIVIVGRLFGWRVVRLVVSPSMWTMLTRMFGDPKVWMPERGRLSYKSFGLKVVDSMGCYWDFVKGVCSRDELPSRQRRLAV